MSDNVGYKAGEVAIGELLANIPGMQAALQGHELVAQQVAQIDSKDMGFDVACTGDGLPGCDGRPEVRGIVITHGTDTLEETAWFLQCILSPEKPVVLTSAMRPATALSPDGPQNLLDAVAVALEPDARGVLAVAAGAVMKRAGFTRRFPTGSMRSVLVRQGLAVGRRRPGALAVAPLNAGQFNPHSPVE